MLEHTDGRLKKHSLRRWSELSARVPPNVPRPEFSVLMVDSHFHGGVLLDRSKWDDQILTSPDLSAFGVARDCQPDVPVRTGLAWVTQPNRTHQICIVGYQLLDSSTIPSLLFFSAERGSKSRCITINKSINGYWPWQLMWASIFRGCIFRGCSSRKQHQREALASLPCLLTSSDFLSKTGCWPRWWLVWSIRSFPMWCY